VRLSPPGPIVDRQRKNKPPLLSGNKHYHHLAASPESLATSNQAERARRDTVIAWRIATFLFPPDQEKVNEYTPKADRTPQKVRKL
jgi:hypothetical protein